MTTDNAPNPTPFHQRYKLPIFVLILLLAMAGRIINIDLESLWVDEGFSYWAIRHPDMLGLVLRDVHPPIYFVLLRAWAELAGITELALRYLSVLPSLVSVVGVYHVARELERRRGNTTASIIPTLAALMMALADMELYISQQVRMYTWHVLWVILSMWAFLRWARTQERRALIGWFVASILLVYTHYIGVCTLAVQGLYALVFLRGRRRVEAVGALVLIGVVFIPWLLVVVSGQTGNIGTGFNVPSTLESLWNWRTNWFTQQWALLGGLALLGLVVLVYRPGRENAVYVRLQPIAPAFLMLAWFVVPVALTYALNFYVPILMDYRITQISPAVALMIAFGLGNLRQPALGFLVGVIVVYGVVSNDAYVRRPPWREVGANAARYAVPGDLAMAHVTPSGDWQVIYYYERFMPEGVVRRSLRQWQLEQGETYVDGLPALLEQHPNVWFMHWSSDRSGFDALANTGHVQTALMTEDWLGNDLNVYRFDVVPPVEEQITGYTSGMILRDAMIFDDQLRVDLWWSVDEALTVDYTVSAILLNSDGVLVAQNDAYPFAGGRPTTTWEAGEVVYDPHFMQVVREVDSLLPGEYTVGVKVYHWTPDGITVMPTLDGEELAVIGRITR